MKHNRFIYILCSVAILQFSCKEFLKLDPPKTSLVNETVFLNDSQALSAVLGMYATMSASNSYASGGSSSITNFTALSADELIGYNALNLPYYENQLTPELSGVSNLYSGPYQSIYTANSILEGTNASNGLSTTVKAQVTGEAQFVRAFSYFYLVNLYGEVPLQLVTDYKVTTVASKSPTSIIYEQIINDLKSAENLLLEAYTSTGRTRPNKSAVQALLARTYLYIKDWENAEKYADLVIKKTDSYGLVNYDGIFLMNSKEAIWQLMPPPNNNTQEGVLFIPSSLTAPPPANSLSKNFALNAFEPNDKRKDFWVKSYVAGGVTYYYPYKYKVRSSSTVSEYSMIFRLTEQYLIRAEARINQPGKIGIGIADLNMVRNRTLPTTGNSNPIPPLSINLSKENALLAVEQERRVELFTEWGHRWFDLKRTDRANAVLGPLKSPNWQSADILYPIPRNEVTRNPNIGN
ncbi:hypothetical protein HDC92_000272 [Pedobacter sp. AK017]|uniref:RagB/SusD family nutrient uptake outer membrane protein n=1 Tax=Pedobacter sp. AK017 TaxID=2723073 RepID=UPI00161B90F7|nr:RagB/SusD family nutrient uptake outer membrane protein [Pedobacter sp. AK017]MBB5436608.1 hypothetical protein [Pedobacter sp. AK017]